MVGVPISAVGICLYLGISSTASSSYCHSPVSLCVPGEGTCFGHRQFGCYTRLLTSKVDLAAWMGPFFFTDR